MKETLRATLKMRDIHFSAGEQTSTGPTGKRCGERRCGERRGRTRGPQRPFVEEIQLASPTIGPVLAVRVGRLGATFA